MGYIRDLKGINNIHGQTIRPNVLLRSAQLYKLKKSQITYLKEIGLKRVIDLRNIQEAKDEPDIKLDNVVYRNFSLIDSNLNGVTHVKSKRERLLMLSDMPTMIETYISMFKDEYSLNQIKKAIREIVLVDEYPTIIHCVTGKDRAGIIVMILLSILDVDYETIVEDYLKQYKYYINKARFLYIAAYLISKDKELAVKAYDYYCVQKKYLDAVIDVINNDFGSIEKFIKEFIELSDEDITRFKNKVLI